MSNETLIIYTIENTIDLYNHNYYIFKEPQKKTDDYWINIAWNILIESQEKLKRQNIYLGDDAIEMVYELMIKRLN